MTTNESYPLPQRGSPTGISALIVGAGVAGSLAALEFWRQGIDVQLIERSPSRLTGGMSLKVMTNMLMSDSTDR